MNDAGRLMTPVSSAGLVDGAGDRRVVSVTGAACLNAYSFPPRGVLHRSPCEYPPCSYRGKRMPGTRRVGKCVFGRCVPRVTSTNPDHLSAALSSRRQRWLHYTHSPHTNRMPTGCQPDANRMPTGTNDRGWCGEALGREYVPSSGFSLWIICLDTKQETI